MKRLLILGLMAIVLIAGCVGPTGDVISDTDTGNGGTTPDTGGTQQPSGEEYDLVSIKTIADNVQDYDGEKVMVIGFFNPFEGFNYLGDREASMTVTGEYDREIWLEDVPEGDYSSGNYEIKGTIESREYCMCQFKNVDLWADYKFETSEFCRDFNLKTDIEYKCRTNSYSYVAYMHVDGLAKK